MPQPPSGEEREKEEPPPPRTTKAEPVKLSDIDLGDTSLQFRVSSPSVELLTDLERKGQREPIELFGVEPPYRIVDGFRRVEAARKLGWDAIEAHVHRDIGEAEAMRIAFTSNIAREHLSFPEKAHAMALARRQGLSRAAIAEVFGMSEERVSNHMKFLNQPDP
jgi:ParB/RepB/Spo0J family partition protein